MRRIDGKTISNPKFNKIRDLKPEMKTLYYNEEISKTNVNSAVIIPALNPVEKLVDFVQRLLDHGIPKIIVVNDGSDSSFNNIFYKLGQMENCTVLTHEINYGKGKALKTAFNFFLKHYSYLDGAVTADADGQHATEDIYRISKELSQRKDSLILGVRDFANNNVPVRSYIGNKITSRIFQFLYGTYLSDTQTGLRGIPTSEVPWMISTSGERYDYEINILINARNHNLNFYTMPIKTLYFDNNSGSHYNPIKDSARIFLCLISGFIKYSMSTIVSGIIDIIIFFLLNSIVFAALSAPVRLLASTVIARVVSSILNFTINRRTTFAHNGNLTQAVIRYYILSIIQMMASYGLVYGVSLVLETNESIPKLFIDFLLGCISYQIQLHWVFKNKPSNDNFSLIP